MIIDLKNKIYIHNYDFRNQTNLLQKFSNIIKTSSIEYTAYIIRLCESKPLEMLDNNY